MTERNRNFRKRLIYTDPIICPERAMIWTRIFQENEDKPAITKAALGLKATLEEMSIHIQEDELIVGNQGNGLRAATLNPLVNTWVIDELDKFEKRDGSVFRIDESTKQKIRDIIPYWKGRNVYESTISLLPQSTIDVMDALVFTCGYTLSKGCGHWLLNIENVLQNGFETYEKQAQDKLDTWDYASAEGIDKIPFYEAIIMTCQSIKTFANRYANVALELAQITQGKRKNELLEIAEICKRVPYYAPQTFYEALQTVYFVQLITHIESDGTGISLGRLDNMLYPFYKEDIEKGILTKEQAEELLDQLWLKIASIIQVWNEEDSKAFGGHPISQAITLGGMDEFGRDATNELSYMMLETTARTHMPQPSVCCRINRNTPREFLLCCVEVIRLGLGMPAMYNDEIAIPALINRGIEIKDARRDYAVIGCVEMGIQGKLCAFANSGYFNMAKTLEIMLHNGKDAMTQKQLVRSKKNPLEIKSYEEFVDIYYSYMRELINHQVRVTNVVDTMHARLAPLPFISAITDNCIEKGREVQAGGAKYNYDGIQGVGFADVVDSFVVIKQLVYQEKKLSMEKLICAIDNNFEGYEDVLLMIRKDVPKYGNNDPEVNAIARDLAMTFCHCIESYSNLRGGFFVPGMYSNSANVPLGSVVKALPNGRKEFTPISEACSPSHGSEKSGPTQAALSVAALDHMILTNGSQYNQKYHPLALAGKKGLQGLSNLIETFFEAGGYHIQFNVVSAETLKKAQENPEQYRDLVVRVAGYTAFFVDLNKEIQNDIIGRTEMDFNL